MKKLKTISKDIKEPRGYKPLNVKPLSDSEIKNERCNCGGYVWHIGNIYICGDCHRSSSN